MQTGDDRDHIVDRSLRASMPGVLTPAGADCLDAEQFAAWQDDGLDPVSVRRIEDHISTCVRCQAMAAAFVRADVATPVPARSLWLLRWLMPAVATAAAAVTIWILVPRPPAVKPGEQIAMGQRTVPAPAPPAPAGVAPSEAAQPGPGGGGGGSAPPRPLPAASPRADELRAPSNAAERQDSAGTLARSVPPPPAAPIETPRDLRPKPPPAVVAQEPLRQQQEAVVAPSAPAPPPPPAPAETESEKVDVAASPFLNVNRAAGADARISNVVVEFTSSSLLTAAGPAGGGAGRGGRGGGRGVANSGVVGGIAAPPPAPPVRWRVFADGRVNRSATNGSSWEAIFFDPTWRVATGTAPSSLVCWLVGAGGVVLRTTDGLHFARVAFPEAIDLTAVQATSDRAATVVTRDGRRFATTDGGTTWQVLNP